METAEFGYACSASVSSASSLHRCPQDLLVLLLLFLLLWLLLPPLSEGVFASVSLSAAPLASLKATFRQACVVPLGQLKHLRILLLGLHSKFAFSTRSRES